MSAGPAVQCGFNPGVHGARGLFAFAVFVYHAGQSGLPLSYTPAGLTANLLTVPLEFGVDLFFCISGYVILGGIGRSTGPREFVGRRLLRILPALWCTLLVILLGMLLRSHEAVAGLDPIALISVVLANFAVLPGVLPIPALNPVAWTLSYELTFYAAAALVWWAPPRFRWLAALVCLSLLAAFPRGIFFLSGCIVASGVVGRSPWLSALAGKPLVWLVIFLAAWTPAWLWLEAGQIRFALPLVPVAFAAATLTLAGIVAGQGSLGALLRSRPLQWLGTVSYSFYLWHLLVMAAVKAMFVSPPLADWFIGDARFMAFVVISLLLTLPIAALSQALVEDRLVRAIRVAWWDRYGVRPRLHGVKRA